jgi:Tfp pilus assembly PilM family ATPase
MSVDPKTILKRFARRRHDVLGFDVGVTTLKAVRLRVIENAVYLVAVAQLPHLSVPTANSESSAAPQPFQIPRSLHAKYVAFALSPPQAVAKLLVVPRPADKLDDFSFAGLLGLDNPDAFRIGVEIASSTHSETTVLASAMPDQVVHWALGLFPIATPAPCSLEISGLAALNAVAYGLKDHPRDEAVMAIDIGAQTSTLGVFLRGDLALLRQFKLGASAIL